MISPRYAAWVIALVALVTVPVAIHSYMDLRLDDGRRTAGIDSVIHGFRSRTTDRQSRWVQRVYESNDWIERYYAVPGHGDLQLFVARSHDPKRLYHHPELGVAYGDEFPPFEGSGVARIAGAPDVPFHVLRGTGGVGIAVYALHSGNRFISNPYVHQVLTSLESLFMPSRPMTLFFVSDVTVSSDADIEQAPATRLLLDAIANFLEQP